MDRRLSLRPTESHHIVRSQPGAGALVDASLPTSFPSRSRAAPPKSTRPRPSLLARAPNPAATPPDTRQNRFLSSRINALRAKLKDKSPKSSQNSRFPNPNQQPAAGAIARWVANRRGRLHRRLWRFHRSSLFPSRRMDSAPGFQHHLRSPQRPLHHGGMPDISN